MVATPTSDDRRQHRRLLSHDVADLAETYDRFAPTVFVVALRVTHDRQAAEDATQEEVLLGLWRRPERFDPGRRASRPWLAAIAHNRSVDSIRREQAARGRDRCHLDMVLTGEVPDVDVDVHAGMTAERVRRAVSACRSGSRHPSGWLTSMAGLTGRWRPTSTSPRAPSSPASARGYGIRRGPCMPNTWSARG